VSDQQQRDAAADLEVCEAATPGPWQADPAFGTPWTVGGDLRNFDKCVTVCETYPEGGISCPQEDYEQGAANAKFIAMAREALPWWIAEAERLRAVIAAAERILTEKTSWAGVSAPSYVTISEHDLRQLLKMLREVNR